MAKKAAPDQVTLTHPSGKFTVTVSAGRVPAMERRGFRAGGKAAGRSSSSAPGGAERAELLARAKALGIPATGTNVSLREAIEAAEAEA